MLFHVLNDFKISVFILTFVLLPVFPFQKCVICNFTVKNLKDRKKLFEKGLLYDSEHMARNEHRKVFRVFKDRICYLIILASSDK